MIHLLRFYLRLHPWKLALALVIVPFVFLAITTLFSPAPPPDPASSPSLHTTLSSNVHRPTYFILTFALAGFGGSILLSTITGWECDLVFPLRRTTLFHARLAFLVLLLTLLILLTAVFFAFPSARSLSHPLRLLPPLINLAFLLLPIAVLIVWLSPWLNVARRFTLLPILIFGFLIIPLLVGACALATNWTSAGLAPSLLGLLFALLLYPFALCTFRRIELVPGGRPSCTLPFPRRLSFIRNLFHHLAGFTRARFDHLSPLNRTFVAALWLDPFFLLFLCYIPFIIVTTWSSLTDGSPSIALPLLLSLVLTAQLPHAMKRLTTLLVMPISRKQLFLRLVTPFLLLDILIGLAGIPLAPFMINTPGFTISSPSYKQGVPSEDAFGEARRAAAERCQWLRDNFDVTAKPDELLQYHPGCATIRFDALLPRLRPQRLKLALYAFLLPIFFLMLALWPAMPSRRTLASPRRLLLLRLFYLLAVLLTGFLLITESAHLRPNTLLSPAFLIRHVAIGVPLLALASILLFLRHLHASRHLEIVSPFTGRAHP